jgi:putative ABC transport system permease protein
MRKSMRGLSAEAGLPFLARRKAACAVAVLTMAVALGANTVVFSVLKAFLLSSFSVPEPDRLFVIAPVRELPGRGAVVFAEAYPNYERIRETQRSFAEVACILPGVASWDSGEEVRPLQSARVTASFFATVGVQPMLGRGFGEEDEGPSPSPVALISHSLWQGTLMGDPGVLGRSLTINGTAHTVIGVMPAGFTHPLPTDIWLPFDIPQFWWTAITGGRGLTVYGRLKDDVTLRTATHEMAELTQRSLEAHADNQDFRYTLQTIVQVLLPSADRTIVLVQAGALVLILLAVLNLASLLIAWGFDRRQEMAVRLALGAGRRRIVRMLLLQSLTVVVAGGLGGLGLSALALPWIRQLEVSPTLALFLSQLELDRFVLLWSGVAAGVAGVVAGALPSWFGRQTDLTETIRWGQRGASLSPAAIRWQKAMVLAQATLTVIILAAAAFIGISFRNLQGIPNGFTPEDRVIARVQLPDAEYPEHEKRAAFAARLLEGLGREPDLAAFGFSSTLPVSDVPWGARFFIQLPDGSLSTEPLLFHFRRTSWNYHATMGIPILSGRAFEERDDATHPNVAIVSRALAERLWPGENPIGRPIYRVLPGVEPLPLEVVGVAGNVMDGGYSAPPGEAVYVPFAQVSVTRMSIVARPRTTPQQAVLAVRRALRAADPGLAASAIAPLESLVTQANALPRLQTILLVVFAFVAMGIAGLGSYGLMSQLVATREREFALRLAFGAPPGRLGWSMLGQAAALAGPGILAGAAVVLLLSGVLRPFLFGVNPGSIGVTLLVSVVTFAFVCSASLSPAFRAARTDVRKGLTS